MPKPDKHYLILSLHTLQAGAIITFPISPIRKLKHKQVKHWPRVAELRAIFLTTSPPCSLRKGRKPKRMLPHPKKKSPAREGTTHSPAALPGRTAPPPHVPHPEATTTHESESRGQTPRSLLQPPLSLTTASSDHKRLWPQPLSFQPLPSLLRPGASHLTSLCLSFPICKLGIMKGLSHRVIMRSK